MTDAALGGSFRDPSGFVFERDGVLYRRIRRAHAPHYDLLMGSGLYRELTGEGLLVPHAEEPDAPAAAPDAYRTIRPERVPFVSYPYEWCFGELRDAAELTLRVQAAALRRGMTLKDASAFNVQFRAGRPVFIDTLSFEAHREGEPWVGYRQFCQHFLAPLALAAYRDPRLLQMLRVHLEGIPLDLARTLLPARAWLNLHLLTHVAVHARFQRRHAGDARALARRRPVARRSLEQLIAALRRALRSLDWEPPATTWSGYREQHSYRPTAAAHRRELLERFLGAARPGSVWDLGANTGEMSRIASDRGIPTLAFDVDPSCVERNYRRVRQSGERHLLPLVLDLANPSPGLGWAHAERLSLHERRSADLLMALALVHHLAIGSGVPLARVAAFLAQLGERLIVEFVPRSDVQVQRMLATREDVFDDYAEEGFRAAFAAHFETEDAQRIRDSERSLYLMRRRA